MNGPAPVPCTGTGAANELGACEAVFQSRIKVVAEFIGCYGRILSRGVVELLVVVTQVGEIVLDVLVAYSQVRDACFSELTWGQKTDGPTFDAHVPIQAHDQAHALWCYSM